MSKRSIDEIKEKIKKGEANIFTAQELKEVLKNEEDISFEDVDVVTCGTCGVMSGTSAIFHMDVAEPGKFQKAKKAYLNGVPVFPGPCPNEFLGSIDLIVYGTTHSIKDPEYGGGFLFKDILNGEKIEVEVESNDGEIFETTVTKDDISRAQLLGTRIGFRNYTAFVNPQKDSVNSIFNGIAMEGNLSQFTFSGCGDLNPLQNDINGNIIKKGTKVLFNGAEGIVLGDGTRSLPAKPNLMVTGDFFEMSSKFIGGFKTGAGPEVYDSIAIPIPILNEEIFKNVQILNKDITLTVADVHGRHLPLSETTYSKVWDGHDERPKFNPSYFRKEDNEKVKKSCPTKSINDNGTIDFDKCFGCGLCVYLTKSSTYQMNLGSVDLELKDKRYDIPISCRQSDLQRAKKISSKLKHLIANENFEL